VPFDQINKSDKKSRSQQRLKLHLELAIDTGKCVFCKHLDEPESLKYFDYRFLSDSKAIDIFSPFQDNRAP